MLSFPLSILLIPYAVLMLAVVFFAFVNFKNLVLYRAEDVISFWTAFIFIAGLGAIAYFSYNYILLVNWTEVINIGVPSFKANF